MGSVPVQQAICWARRSPWTSFGRARAQFLTGSAVTAPEALRNLRVLVPRPSPQGDDDTDPFLHPTEAGSSFNRPTEFWQKVLDVNLTGVMLCAREAARQMVAEGHGGTIVNFASTAAYNPSPNMTDYCVSKTGVVMLTRCFATEFGPHGIRVNAVAPGPIETPMLARVHRARGDNEGFRSLPLGRTAQPEEVAELVLFFTSERSSYVTGKTLGVDGGTSTL
ncbi:MAG: SDR family oxidoreductase [Gammaproteobacteria bacterium]|nr:SDR family oxidoreductase [Gammaproteobacteria bacterium]